MKTNSLVRTNPDQIIHMSMSTNIDTQDNYMQCQNKQISRNDMVYLTEFLSHTL